MSTLLDKTSLPAWVFIIIIAVGSIFIIITIALIIKCHVVRRRAKRNSSVIDQGPMRRMTVRRGRMVPASNYLSLTGSRFGLNQFDDADTLKSGRKSPFEWWSSVKEKKQDDISCMERGQSGSVGDVFGRHDFAQSTSSLESDKHAVATIQEVEPAFPSPTALPSPTPNRTASFSRPFNPRMPSSPFAHSRGLSKIEESSPHNSVISVRSNPRKSGMSINAIESNPTTYEPRRPSSTSRSSSMSTTSTPSSQSPRSPSNPEILRPTAYQGSRASLGEIEPPRQSLSKRSSMSRHDSVTDVSRHATSHSVKPPMPANENAQEYWSSRQDLQPISRSNSKKGKVLRKKSLKRQEAYSMVAT